MRKRGKKLLAMMLAMSMTMNVVSMQAFADEPVVETETQGPVDNGDGTATGTTITTTTTTDSETGNVTVNVKIEKEVTDTNQDTNSDDGVDVSGKSKREEETITDEDGKLVEKSWVEDGEEKKEWTEEDAGDGEQEEVEVPLVPGEKTEAKYTETKADGNVNSSEGQTITTTTDRTVTAETSEIDTVVNEVKNDLTSVKPENYEGKYSETGNHLFHSYKDGASDSYKVTGEAPVDGAYQFITDSDHGVFWVSKIVVNYKKDADGNTVYDENNQPVIETLTKADGTVMLDPETLEPSTDLNQLWKYYNKDKGRYEFAKTGSRPTMFMLKDENGNDAYGYCIDLVTGADEKTGTQWQTWKIPIIMQVKMRKSMFEVL